jgi:imidazolonepropionase-like amidohydrolase
MATSTQRAVIRGVTVIDGTESPPLRGVTVAIAGDRIESVAASAEADIPAHSDLIDGRGKYLIPGLVDMHVHVNLCGSEALPLWLASGVTSVRDIGGSVEQQLPWRSELAAGARVGPRLFVYGPMIDGAPSTFAGEPGGNFERLWSEVDGPEQGVAEVDRLLALGVDGLKLYQNLPLDTLRAMLRRVDGRVPVTGHLTRTLASDAIRAGISCLEHTMLTAYNDVCRPEDRTPPGWTMRTPGYWAKIQQGWARADLDAPHARDFVQLIAASGVFFDPTSSLGTNALGLEETEAESGQRYLTPTLRRNRKRNTQRARAAGAPPPPVPDPAQMVAAGERQLEFVARLHQAGATVLAGTDTGAVPPLIPGFALHRELRWLVRAGMSPAQALQRATRGAAECLRRGGDQGALRPGRRADMVLLDADPLSDIRNTRRIHRVIKDGLVHDPAELLAACERDFAVTLGA